MSERERIGVLFVCLGNICRSPLAKSVFRQIVREAGLDDRFDVDAAGTSAYHIGDGPDARTVATAQARGLEVEHSARQVHATDFERFDYIVVMDRENLRNTERVRDRAGHDREVLLLRSFDPEANGADEVPDPWFGGEEGFIEVQDMIERSCRALFEHVRAEHGL
ncbi:MAG: low molecular weight protein-tyrosine-phosphatase [Longimicrobiales bacterium]